MGLVEYPGQQPFFPVPPQPCWKKRYQQAPPHDLGTSCFVGLLDKPNPRRCSLARRNHHGHCTPFNRSLISNDVQCKFAFGANYLNLENYAFDAKYSDLEYFDCGLPINKIAPTFCIYEIFTDNIVVSRASTCTPSHAHDLVLGRSLNHVQRV